jgi:hypothetical protein
MLHQRQHLNDGRRSDPHRDAMRSQAEALADRIAVRPDSTLTLDLPASLKDVYSEAYGRYR